MTRSVFHIPFCLIIFQISFAQQPTKTFQSEQFKTIAIKQYGFNKIIPKEIEPQVLTALSFYPELKDIKITFRIRKRKTPLTSRPRVFSVFRKKRNRNYIITISSESKDRFTPILFSNLPYNAQIGVLGHELAHVSHYNAQNTFQLLRLSIGMLSSKYVDKFEWNTDKGTIVHGLGYQLYDWSSYVREVLNIKEWLGASQNIEEGNSSPINERYMSPTTILEFIRASDNYPFE